FHPDPLHPGRTVYRTGDLARRCPDGSYVLVGRVDGQLKVRGHRVEPGDVESTLRRHPAVLDAGVHAPIGSDGERSLTACYVLRPGRSADSTELASWCGQHLPRYLVPTLWLSVEALPRTPSGKVDRNALPVADGGQIGGTGSRGELDAEEQAVLGVWCEILGVDEVDIHRDFFLVGGNSLSATQVVAR